EHQWQGASQALARARRYHQRAARGAERLPLRHGKAARALVVSTLARTYATSLLWSEAHRPPGTAMSIRAFLATGERGGPIFHVHRDATPQVVTPEGRRDAKAKRKAARAARRRNRR